MHCDRFSNMSMDVQESFVNRTRQQQGMQLGYLPHEARSPGGGESNAAKRDTRMQ